MILMSHLEFSVPAKLKFNMLHSLEASMYTRKNGKWIWNLNYNIYILYLLCSFVLKPQISGGTVDPGEVTVKESVKHCPMVDIGVVVAPAT